MAKNKATTYEEVVKKFHSMPLTKFEIQEGLEREWFSTAVADYELNIGCDLEYNEKKEKSRKICFSHKQQSISFNSKECSSLIQK